jgi:hypothetical protein
MAAAAAGCWLLLAAGCCCQLLLAAGCWLLLAAGCCCWLRALSAAGCWLLLVDTANAGAWLECLVWRVACGGCCCYLLLAIRCSCSCPCGLWAAGCGLRAAGCGLRAAGGRPPTAKEQGLPSRPRPVSQGRATVFCSSRLSAAHRRLWRCRSAKLLALAHSALGHTSDGAARGRRAASYAVVLPCRCVMAPRLSICQTRDTKFLYALFRPCGHAASYSCFASHLEISWLPYALQPWILLKTLPQACHYDLCSQHSYKPPAQVHYQCV